MLIAVRYALFAVLATAMNLLTQYVSFRMYHGPASLFVAMAMGTLAGLAAKYLLDKRWVFHDSARGCAAHAKRFSLYSLTGLFTTGIFWGTEIAFASLSSDESMRFVGAVVGLTIGYVIKYRLDRRFVFTARVA